MWLRLLGPDDRGGEHAHVAGRLRHLGLEVDQGAALLHGLPDARVARPGDLGNRQLGPRRIEAETHGVVEQLVAVLSDVVGGHR